MFANWGDFFQNFLINLIFVVMFGGLMRWRDKKKEIKISKIEIGRRLFQKLSEYAICNIKKYGDSEENEILYDICEISIYLQIIIYEIGVLSKANKREYKDVSKQLKVIVNDDRLGNIIKDCRNGNGDIEVVRKKQKLASDELLNLANSLYS